MIDPVHAAPDDGVLPPIVSRNPPVNLAALRADHHAGKGGVLTAVNAFILTNVEIHPPRHFVLNAHENLASNDCLLASFHIVLRNDASVCNTILGKEIHCIGLLQKGITDVFFVGHNLFDRRRNPLFFPRTGKDAIRHQAVANVEQAAAFHILPVNPLHNLRLFRLNDEFSVFVFCVAEKAVMVDLHLPILVSELQPKFDVLGKALALLLRKACHDGQENFSLSVHCVYVLLLEADRTLSLIHI